MSDKQNIEKPIPYGKELIIKERDLEEFKEEVNSKFEEKEANKVTVGFEDPERIRQILTPKRRELMKAVLTQEPESISELANITERGLSEVHSDLKTLERNKIIYFETNGKRKKPVIPYEKIQVKYDLKSSLEELETGLGLEKGQ